MARHRLPEATFSTSCLASSAPAEPLGPLPTSPRARVVGSYTADDQPGRAGRHRKQCLHTEHAHGVVPSPPTSFGPRESARQRTRRGELSYTQLWPVAQTDLPSTAALTGTGVRETPSHLLDEPRPVPLLAPWERAICAQGTEIGARSRVAVSASDLFDAQYGQGSLRAGSGSTGRSSRANADTWSASVAAGAMTLTAAAVTAVVLLHPAAGDDAPRQIYAGVVNDAPGPTSQTTTPPSSTDVASVTAPSARPARPSPSPTPLAPPPITAMVAAPSTVAPTVGILTSGFGARWGSTHLGLDIANAIGTPVVSVTAGEVLEAGPANGFGLWIRVRQDDGTIGVYGHIDQALVTTGERVEAGQQIATMGNRGISTGSHLHYEVRQDDGSNLDPAQWLLGRGVSVQ